MGVGPSREKLVRRLDEERGRLAALSKGEANLLQMVEDVGYTPQLRAAVKENRLALQECQRTLQELDVEMLKADGGAVGELFGDATYAERICSILYESGAAEAEEREIFNRKLLRAVHGVWLFAYDCALVQFKSGALMLVAMEPKVKGRGRPKFAEFRAMEECGVPPVLDGMLIGGWERAHPAWLGGFVSVMH